MRKRIAVLVGQVDETTQNRFLKGFMKQAYTHDYDVCVFSLHQKYQETWLRDIGDSNIFELVNYDLFDAVLILLDTILTKDLKDPLQRSVKERFKGPVLVVDQESDIFESVMMDHYTPVRKLVDHLIDVHGYKDIAFLGGKKGHIHSVQRLNAFMDSMNAHHLPIREEWIYHGNYWYDSAESFIDELLKDREHMPRAIACANDIMAIGAGARLTENGVKVPEEVALVGYDSIEEGRHSPKPLTSAEIPAGECGEYCLLYLDAAILGKETPKFEPKAPIFVGGSCGCHHEIEMVPKKLRSVWRTQNSSRSMFSEFNHMLEDMLSQNTLEGFWENVRNYVYQIKPFAHFDIFMNDGFMNPENNIGEKALRKGYTDKVYHVLSCDGQQEEGEGDIFFDHCLDVKDLIPALHEERDYPTTYIFNPIYSDDRCFGYAVLNYATEMRVYDESYRVWMRDVMQGMESFYRQQYLQALIERVKADQIRDSVTGLYNYQGFLKRSSEILLSEEAEEIPVVVIAVDVKNLKSINELHGREYGDKVIRALARFIRDEVREDEVCARMSNDEFLLALRDTEEVLRGQEIISNLEKKMTEFRATEEFDAGLDIHTADLFDEIQNSRDLEALVNRTVSVKNHKKIMLRQVGKTDMGEVMDEIKRNQLVDKILTQNLLTYYYQPIVNAEDGSIYAYEALMRCEAEKISPLQIIQSAHYLNRLHDVERATLLNVTADVEKHLEDFGEAKVFINSLPGQEMTKGDSDTFARRVINSSGRFVIEFTEESELDDLQLNNFKEKYKELGCDIAIDDYGAGYSNVNNLLRYLPNYVKIDRQLITEIHEQPQKQHFVRNIIEYAHNNGVKALAEGVETKEELRECIRMGIDLIQGYYTGKPARNPISRIEETIENEIRRFRMSAY